MYGEEWSEPEFNAIAFYLYLAGMLPGLVFANLRYARWRRLIEQDIAFCILIELIHTQRDLFLRFMDHYLRFYCTSKEGILA